jgi:hypothetical protein
MARKTTRKLTGYVGFWITADQHRQLSKICKSRGDSPGKLMKRIAIGVIEERVTMARPDNSIDELKPSFTTED